MASLPKQLLAAAALTTGQAIGLAAAAASENPEISRAISEMIRSDDEAKRKRETEENFNMKRICKYKEGGFCTRTNPIFRDQNELKAAEEWVDKEHADGYARTLPRLCNKHINMVRIGREARQAAGEVGGV